jgi:hypothetical protein
MKMRAAPLILIFLSLLNVYINIHLHSLYIKQEKEEKTSHLHFQQPAADEEEKESTRDAKVIITAKVNV